MSHSNIGNIFCLYQHFLEKLNFSLSIDHQPLYLSIYKGTNILLSEGSIQESGFYQLWIKFATFSILSRPRCNQIAQNGYGDHIHYRENTLLNIS